MRKLLRKAKRRGWKIIGVATHSLSHNVLEWTDGTRVTASATPSDHRSFKNFIADMKRVEQNTP